MDDEDYLLQELEPLKDNHEKVYKVCTGVPVPAAHPPRTTEQEALHESHMPPK